jgi:hypothetical protein
MKTPPAIAGHLRLSRCAFTLVELLVSTGASAIILGALLLSATSLHRALQSSETYAGAYSDQRRITDYLGRDLRRAVNISATDATGSAVDFANGATLTVADLATLQLTLPAYYASNLSSDPGYETALTVVGDAATLDYGTPDGIAPPVEVSFRKVNYGPAGCVCFLRQEAGVDRIVVRAADNLSVQVTVAPGAQSCSIKTWYRAMGSGPAPLVSTFDQVLLRNTPLGYKP